MVSQCYYWQDRNRNRGGIIYICDDIPSKLLTKHVFPDNIEGLFVELISRQSKWLLTFNRSCLSPSTAKQQLLHLDKAVDIYSNFEKVLLTGDFNSEITEPCMDSFLYQHDMTSFVKEQTCFKSITNPTSTDLFLTNSNLSMSLSDFHVSSYFFKDLFFQKRSLSRELDYCNYKNFDSVLFNKDLRQLQQKTFVTLSRFWLLRGQGSLSESVNKGKFVTKIFFQIFLNEVFRKMMPADAKANRNKKKSKMWWLHLTNIRSAFKT